MTSNCHNGIEAQADWLAADYIHRDDLGARSPIPILPLRGNAGYRPSTKPRYNDLSRLVTRLLGNQGDFGQDLRDTGTNPMNTPKPILRRKPTQNQPLPRPKLALTSLTHPPKTQPP